MRVPALLSAAVAVVLAGAARAEVEFRFYEGLECTAGAEGLTMVVREDNRLAFDRQVYRTVMAIQREGDPCAWNAHLNYSSAQDRPSAAAAAVRARADPVRVFADCHTYFNPAGQSYAISAIEVHGC